MTPSNLPEQHFKTRLPLEVIAVLAINETAVPTIEGADGEMIEIRIIHLDLVHGWMHWVPIDPDHWGSVAEHFQPFYTKDEIDYE